MRSTILLFNCFLLGLCASCSTKEEDASLAAPVVELRVEPADLTSEVGETPIRFIIGRYGPPIEQELIDEIVNSIEIVASDGQVRKPSVSKLEGFFADDDPARKSFSVYQVPTPSLSPGWNTVRVRTPNGIKAHPLTVAPTSAASGQDGWATARLNPNSAPVLRAVLVCDKSDDEVKVRLLFSEFINYTPGGGASSAIEVSADGVPCDALALAPREGSVENTTEVAEFGCLAAKNGHYSIRLAASLQSASGMQATVSANGDGDIVEFDSASLTQTVDGCLLERDFAL